MLSSSVVLKPELFTPSFCNESYLWDRCDLGAHLWFSDEESSLSDEGSNFRDEDELTWAISLAGEGAIHHLSLTCGPTDFHPPFPFCGG